MTAELSIAYMTPATQVCERSDLLVGRASSFMRAGLEQIPDSALQQLGDDIAPMVGLPVVREDAAVLEEELHDSSVALETAAETYDETMSNRLSLLHGLAVAISDLEFASGPRTVSEIGPSFDTRISEYAGEMAVAQADAATDFAESAAVQEKQISILFSTRHELDGACQELQSLVGTYGMLHGGLERHKIAISQLTARHDSLSDAIAEIDGYLSYADNPKRIDQLSNMPTPPVPETGGSVESKARALSDRLGIEYPFRSGTFSMQSKLSRVPDSSMILRYRQFIHELPRQLRAESAALSKQMGAVETQVKAHETARTTTKKQEITNRVDIIRHVARYQSTGRLTSDEAIDAECDRLEAQDAGVNLGVDPAKNIPYAELVVLTGLIDAKNPETSTLQVLHWAKVALITFRGRQRQLDRHIALAAEAHLQRVQARINNLVATALRATAGLSHEVTTGYTERLKPVVETHDLGWQVRQDIGDTHDRVLKARSVPAQDPQSYMAEHADAGFDDIIALVPKVSAAYAAEGAVRLKRRSDKDAEGGK